MTVSEGLHAPFLFEDNHLLPTPEELRARPSELALSRMKDLAAAVSFQYYKSSECQPMEYFLRNQALGFWDDVVTTLHADDETYQAFLKRIAHNSPAQWLRSPDVFDPLLDDSEKDWLLAMHNQDYRNRAHSLVLLPNVLDTKKMTKEADDFIAINPDTHWSAQNISLSLLHCSLPKDKKQKLFKDALAKSDLFWAAADHYFQPAPGLAKTPEDMMYAHTIGNIKQLIADDIIDPEDIKTDLEHRIKGMPGEDYYEKYKRRYPIIAKAALRLENVISDGDSSEEVVADYIRCYYAAQGDVQNETLYNILKLDYVSRDFLLREAASISKMHADYLEADIEKFENVSFGQPFSNDNESLHHDDAAVVKLYEKFIPHYDGEPLSRAIHRDYKIMGTVYNYDGDLTEKHLALTDKLLQIEGEGGLAATHHVRRLSRVYEGHPERLKDILTYNIAHGRQGFDFENWAEWANITGLSKADVQNMLYKSLHDESSPFNQMNDLKDVIIAPDPLMTMDEIAQHIRNSLLMAETNDYLRSRTAGFMLGHFGRALSTKYFGDFSIHDSPEIAKRFEHDNPVSELLVSGDYYDIVNSTGNISVYGKLYGPESIRPLIAKCVVTLSTEHLEDNLGNIWGFMIDAERDEVLAKLYANPALAEFSFSGEGMRSMISEHAQSRQIEAEPARDRLQHWAPKSYTSFMRRLRAKEREPIARRNLLLQYAYPYDLCHRLDGFEGGEAVFATLRGKTEEKNELRALEAMVLMHEAGNIHSGQQLISHTDKAALELVAFTGLAQSAGLDKAASLAAAKNLLSQDIDIVKFGMWMHNSFRSQKIKKYLSSFLKHTAEGGDLQAWKFDTAFGNNLPPSLSDPTVDAWRADSSETHTITGGQPVTVRYSHDLESMYLCGARPSSNCLHYAYGLNQRGLVGVMNADTKMISLLNANNKPIGNAILRITTHMDKPQLTLEPLYHSLSNSVERTEANHLLLSSAERYADSIGLPFTVISTKFGSTTEIAKLRWGDDERSSQTNLVLNPLSPFTYTDNHGVGKKAMQIYTIAHKL